MSLNIMSDSKPASLMGRPIQKPNKNNLPELKVNKPSDNSKEVEEDPLNKDDDDETSSKPIILPLQWLSALWVVGLFFIGIFGLFVFSLILNTIQSLLQFPLWLQIPGWGVVIFFTAIVVYPLLRLFKQYQRLSTVQQICIRTIQTSNSVINLKKVNTAITDYLQNYPLDDPALQQQFKQIQFSVSEIRKTKTSLLSEDNCLTTQDKLKQFESGFLQPLDEAIVSRIEYYAKMAALKTALSPNSLIDMAVIMYNGFSLLREICLLYQVRTGRLGTLYLFALILFQSYIAGQVQENLSQAEDAISSLAEGALGSAAAKVSAFIGSRVAEAGLHYLFLQRIGKLMQRRLRPLK
ncbi:DUF697 domain-containing protein [Candidatus Venteria ishoeyi]|uniref:DUF697 domain-containing protein n=1 Tax=Candidatus Venteria ishoeyi TaxID=1899563 RepID=UPI0025A5203E|nr:DUF697 domain-containing protein [Candidatus Venteria ishoeyi]MDM8545586.1 DUF697 domain-containing protein [Candidatus Venteria ishoeyi]